jgi:hypothetical protein
MDEPDWRKDLKALYAPKAGVVSLVDVQPMRFLMLDGAGDPNGSAAYAAVLEALHALAQSNRSGSGPIRCPRSSSAITAISASESAKS